MNTGWAALSRSSPVFPASSNTIVRGTRQVWQATGASAFIRSPDPCVTPGVAVPEQALTVVGALDADDDCLAGHVVLGRTEPAAHHHRVRPLHDAEEEARRQIVDNAVTG